MADLTLTVDNDLIADTEQRVIYATVLTTQPSTPHILVRLPAVVSGGAGAAVDFDSLIEFRSDVDGEIWVYENSTGVLVVRVPRFSSLCLRSTGNLDGEPPWELTDKAKEILAVAEHATIADFNVVDPVSQLAAMALSTADTYAQATVDTEVNLRLDGVADDFETKMATAFALFEANSLHILHALRAGGNATLDQVILT